MSIYDLKSYFYDCKIEIDTEVFETLWKGYSNNIPNYLHHCEIIDITTNANYILIRVSNE